MSRPESPTPRCPAVCRLTAHIDLVSDVPLLAEDDGWGRPGSGEVEPAA